MMQPIDLPSQSCPHCGNIHTTTCPRIRAIDYNADGTIKRVEFHAKGDDEPSAEDMADVDRVLEMIKNTRRAVRDGIL